MTPPSHFLFPTVEARNRKGVSISAFHHQSNVTVDWRSSQRRTLPIRMRRRLLARTLSLKVRHSEWRFSEMVLDSPGLTQIFVHDPELILSRVSSATGVSLRVSDSLQIQDPIFSTVSIYFPDSVIICHYAVESCRRKRTDLVEL